MCIFLFHYASTICSFFLAAVSGVLAPGGGGAMGGSVGVAMGGPWGSSGGGVVPGGGGPSQEGAGQRRGQQMSVLSPGSYDFFLSHS